MLNEEDYNHFLITVYYTEDVGATSRFHDTKRRTHVELVHYDPEVIHRLEAIKKVLNSVESRCGSRGYIYKYQIEE